MNKQELKALERKQTAHMQKKHVSHDGKDTVTGPVGECMRGEMENGKKGGKDCTQATGSAQSKKAAAAFNRMDPSTYYMHGPNPVAEEAPKELHKSHKHKHSHHKKSKKSQKESSDSDSSDSDDAPTNQVIKNALSIVKFSQKEAKGAVKKDPIAPKVEATPAPVAVKKEDKKIEKAEKAVKKEENKVEENSLANGVSDTEVTKILA